MSVHLPQSNLAEVGAVSRMGELFGGSVLESVQRACLVLCVVVVPFTTAWAKELGIAILFLSAAVLMSIGAMRALIEQRPAAGSLTPLVLAGCACLLVLIQLVPLPQSVLGVVTPVQHELFQSWPSLSTALSTPSEWQTISVTPHLTASGLALASAYFMLVGGLWFYLRSAHEVSWLIRLIAIATAGMAVVGLSQLLFGNGKFLWLFENAMRSAEWPAKGTFTNQNHFAGFLAVGVGCCLYQALGTRKPPKRSPRTKPSSSSQSSFAKPRIESETLSHSEKVWAGVTMVVLLAAILSFSRGGIAAMIVAMTVSCFGFRSRLPALSRLLLPAIAFCLLGLIAFGSDAMTAKWDRLVTSSSLSDVSAGRVALWNSILAAAPSFAFAGAGAGSHAEVYPLWMVEDFGKRFSHAENGYLQLLLEMGAPGLLLMAIILIVVFRKILSGFSNVERHVQTSWLICMAGVLASLFHSLTDFVWYIPACLLVTLTLLVILFRSAEFYLQSQGNNLGVAMPRLMPWMAFLIVGVMVTLGTPRVIADARSEGCWLEYRGLAINSARESKDGSTSADQVAAMITALEDCLAADPQDSRAMSDLSILYLRRFELGQKTSDNPMSIAEIRGTVKSVTFGSRRETLQWMVKAFGSGVGDLFRAAIAARASLAGQPLRASPYLTLHQLAFLIADDPKVEDQLKQQVLILRPHSAAVRYAIGLADLESGDLDSGLQRLSFAFQKDKALRPLILSQILDLVPLPELVEALDTDSEGLLQIFIACRNTADDEKIEWVAQRFDLEFQESTHPQNFMYWNSASEVFKYLNNHEAEIVCLKKCLVYRPDIYEMRQRLALRLAEFGNVDEGIAALKACLIRKPNDAAVKSRLHQMVSYDKRIAVEMTN